MSAEGIRAAQWIARVQPVRAACLAAELRNAITPTSLVASGFACQSLFQEELGDLQATVDHVLAIAEALQPSVIARPDRDSSGGHEVSVPDPYDCIEGYRG